MDGRPQCTDDLSSHGQSRSAAALHDPRCRAHWLRWRRRRCGHVPNSRRNLSLRKTAGRVRGAQRQTSARRWRDADHPHRLSRFLAWRQVLVIVKHGTLIRRHRKASDCCWRCTSHTRKPVERLQFAVDALSLSQMSLRISGSGRPGRLRPERRVAPTVRARACKTPRQCGRLRQSRHPGICKLLTR
jgi:hypothetical protein